MVKAYLRYNFDQAVGLVSGHAANVLLHENYIISGNSQYVLVLDSKTGAVVKMLFEKDKNSEVVSLAISSQSSSAEKVQSHNVLLAAGFADGDVVVWNWEDFSYKCNLNGHKASVTHIQFNEDATQLISGSQDTSIIVWDVLGEQPLYKLTGHKNAITDMIYYKYYENEYVSHDLILSTSKDGLFKVWDMSIAGSIQTMSSLSNEVWNMVLYRKEKVILLGTNNDEIILLKFAPQVDPLTNSKKLVQHIGTFKKQSFSRPLQMELSFNQELLFLMSTNIHPSPLLLKIYNKSLLLLANDKTIEVYRILNDEELAKKQKRKEKKLKKKSKTSDANAVNTKQTTTSMEIEDAEEENGVEEEADAAGIVVVPVGLQFSDRIQYQTTFHFTKKSRSFTFFTGVSKGRREHSFFAVNYHNNNVELFKFSTNEQSVLEHQLVTDFSRLGHRHAVRALAVSDNDAYLASGGGESIKLWATEEMQSMRTFETGHITCLKFLPRNRFFLAADKVGTIYLIDIPKGEIIQTITGAHEAAVWSIDFHEAPHGSDSIVILTGGADKKLKFWELIISSETQLLQLQEIKTLYMKEEVLCARYAPGGYHYAVSLLDSSIEINFSDSDKLFLQFYGHKLPVMSFDISSDNALLLSGSADKNVKIWGMDYGNCHKSIFAHQDAITAVKFVKDTHYFFSASKDRTVKYWDGDTYKLVMQFDENHGEVWSFAVSSIADCFYTGSADRIIRVFKQSKEQVFVQEEEEKRMDKMMIEDYAEEQLKREGDDAHKKQLAQQSQEVAEVIKKKFENLKYGEEIMAAIDQAEELRETYTTYEIALIEYRKGGCVGMAPEKPNQEVIFNMSIPEYVLYVVSKIKATELENSMKFVHMSYVEKILYYLNFYVVNNINTELASRLLFYILKTHEAHILNSKKLLALLVSIQKHLRTNIQKERDTIGMNIAAISMIANDVKSRKTDNIFADEIFTKRSTLF